MIERYNDVNQDRGRNMQITSNLSLKNIVLKDLNDQKTC